MTTDFGTCWSCVTDLSSPAVMVTGFRVVAEAIARRWMTPRGGLIDDPNYGFDLTDMIGDDFDVSSLAKIAQQAAAEAKKDRRVLNCSVTVKLINGEFQVSASVQTANGPFALVASVSNVTVSLLQVTP